MAGTIVEWLTFFLLIFLFVVAVIAEVQWLIKNGWATSGRATWFVITTDLVGLGTGGLAILTAFFAMFVMVMGPAGRGSDVPGYRYLAVSIVAIIAMPVILILLKRLFLLIFKIRSDSSAWLYSLVSSILIMIVVLVPPPLVLYLIVTIWKL